MSKEVSLIDYDKETEAISKYEHYSVGFHNTFGDIRSLHVRLTPLIAKSRFPIFVLVSIAPVISLISSSEKAGIILTKLFFKTKSL
jgi:hypothetical protein